MHSRQEIGSDVTDIEQSAKAFLPIELENSRYVTLSEINRLKLSEEITRLKLQLSKEQAIKAKEEQEFEEALEAALKSTNKNIKMPSKLMNNCDICSLNWPRFFGETCLLDPENGTSLGTVIADSACDILAIHKYQLQTFHIGENLQLRVQARSIRYPSDAELISTIDRQKAWQKYRNDLLKAVPKSRWPTQDVEYEQMVFSSHSLF